MIRILLLGLLALVAARNFEDNLEGYTYSDFCKDFGNNYDVDRKTVFETNLRKIMQHNSEGHSWTLAVNKYADLTSAEFKATFKGYSPFMSSFKDSEVSFPTGPVPDSVDWRTKNVLTPVKNQGGCGSCWAFATTQTVESYTAIQTKAAPPVLSPQDVTSCTLNPNHCGGTGGCDGATAELGLGYVAKNGIALEKDYPYRGVTGHCESKPRNTHINGFKKLPANNYTALVTALANVGPVAISVSAEPWQFYSRGIFTCPQGNVDLDHAVQAVGYGSEGGKDYWIVRNSWGPGWGEDGFIRLARHSDGDESKWCGTDNTPSDGDGCKDGPPTLKVCGTCGIWYDNCYAI